MRRCVRRVITLLLPTLALALSASAQIMPAEVGETGFFGPGVTSMFEQGFPTFSPAFDKNNPVKMQMPMGVMYGFFHQGDPYLVIGGTGKIDFGQDVVLPSDALMVDDFVWIYSRKNITLQVSDFPAELGDKLRKFWTLPSITLLEKGSVLRAAPTGDVLDAVRGFLMLDNLSGTTVLAVAKNKTVKTTQLMLNGAITNPFRMEMTLTNPLISYTKRTRVPGTVMGLASDINIKNHAYQFLAEGDVKLRKPEIFVLKTASMNPQNVVDVVAALSKPLFPSAVGTIPPWNLGGIPTFQLHPPKTASPAFPPEDQSRVVVYAAIADKPEWGIKGPALKIRGNLAIETKPKQDIALVEIAVDKSSLNATFGLPSFSLPNSDLTFGTATATLGAAARTSHLGIAAESGSPCLKQKFNFSVDQSGVPKFDANADQTLKALTPEGFMGSFKTCANEGAKLAQWTLKAGEQLLEFGRDQLIKAASPVFGAGNVAAAAKVLGYPQDLIASSLAAVVPSAGTVLRIGKDVFGPDQLGAFGKAAGYPIETIFAWHKMDSRMRSMPSLNFKNAGDIQELMDWGRDYGEGLTGAGKLAGTLFPKDDMLNAGKKVFNEIGLGGVAFLGRTAGYTATDLSHYFYATGVTKANISKVLQGGGFVKDQAVGAIVTVYGGTRNEAEKLWNGVAEPAGDALKKGCHTVLGWAKIC